MTSFQQEPLKSFNEQIEDGIFLAARARLPNTCQSNACKIAHAILGKDSWLMLSGKVNLKGLTFQASVLDRKINDKFTLSEVEFYVKVSVLFR